MELDINFGELSNDAVFIQRVKTIEGNLDKIQSALQELYNQKDIYDELDTETKAEIDIFLLYASNCLLWFQLRMKGIDPNKHPIKNELSRIREVMKRFKDVKNIMNNRPKLNVDAAKRFIRSGLWDPNEAVAEPPNKRIKFAEVDD